MPSKLQRASSPIGHLEYLQNDFRNLLIRYLFVSGNVLVIGVCEPTFQNFGLSRLLFIDGDGDDDGTLEPLDDTLYSESGCEPWKERKKKRKIQ